jgi:hypothetical protein
MTTDEGPAAEHFDGKNLNEANFDIDQFDGVSLCKFGRRKFDGDQFL